MFTPSVPEVYVSVLVHGTLASVACEVPKLSVIHVMLALVADPPISNVSLSGVDPPHPLNNKTPTASNTPARTFCIFAPIPVADSLSCATGQRLVC